MTVAAEAESSNVDREDSARGAITSVAGEGSEIVLPSEIRFSVPPDWSLDVELSLSLELLGGFETSLRGHLFFLVGVANPLKSWGGRFPSRSDVRAPFGGVGGVCGPEGSTARTLSGTLSIPASRRIL